MLSSATGDVLSLGLAAFDSLRAEDEPWLAQCYVPPPAFPFMAGWRSVIVFGGSGSGLTALQMAIERQACRPDHTPRLLLARWPLTLLATQGLSGTALVEEQLRHISSGLAEALVEHLGRYPANWQTAPTWARSSLTWFIQRYLLRNLPHYLDSLAEDLVPAGLEVLHAISTGTAPDVLPPNTPPPLLIGELIRALQKVGLEGIWVMLTDVAPWVAADSEHAVVTLHAFLSSLTLFEHPRFAYKMLLPDELESPLWSAGSIARQRVEAYSLAQQWDAATLQSIVEQRVSSAVGDSQFQLTDLCEDADLVTWLARCGGASPRGWLQFARPLFAAFLKLSTASGARRPLTKKAYHDLQKRHAPRLFFDAQTGQVTVGAREIRSLPTGTEALLRHLYQHRGTLCPYRDLYRVYLEAYPDGQPEPDARRIDYAGTLDTAIWRLRGEIEPDPKHHTLVITVKNKGVRLDNAW
ncbi:MAG: hypothetical protein U0768_08995 [Anaerolineae bacterium]